MSQSSSEVFFSIVVPTYNRASFIVETIASVLAQSYLAYEIIVVDDGSTDNTQPIVSKLLLPNIRYYKIINSERGAARNFGVSKAKGLYVTFLDSDDVYYPNYLSNAFESLQKYSNPPFFHLAYEIGTKNHIHTKINQLRNDDLSMFTSGNLLSCIGVFVKREIFLEHQFCEDRHLAGSEDYELWMRLAANYGIKIDNRISARLNLHDLRSVLQINVHQLIKRKNLFLFYVFQDPAVQKHFNRYLTQVEAFSDSYISLHLILAGKLKIGWRHFFYAFRTNPLSVMNIRGLAIFKHTILHLLEPKATS